MNINELIAIVKSKLEREINIQDLTIEDKSFLHKNHKGHRDGKFHLKIMIKSVEFSKSSKIESTKRVYNILSFELKHYIHSIQILFN
jgi:BolA family transcriptional regulator, general stress-responsive regulator